MRAPTQIKYRGKVYKLASRDVDAVKPLTTALMQASNEAAHLGRGPGAGPLTQLGKQVGEHVGHAIKLIQEFTEKHQ